MLYYKHTRSLNPPVPHGMPRPIHLLSRSLATRALLVTATSATLLISPRLPAEEAPSPYSRQWLRTDGLTINAVYIATDGDNVIIESQADRARYTVPIADLSPADRGYVQSRRSSAAAPSRKSSGFSLPFFKPGKGLFSKSKNKSTPELAATSRIHGTPDFLQTTRAADLPLGGSQHCGPAAAANALTYLSLTGFPYLSLGGLTPEQRQIILVRNLGSPAFMRTDKAGTSPWNLVTGLDSFIRFRGYHTRKLEFQGWQPVPTRYTSRSRIPNLEDARETLDKRKSAVLVNIGFYRPDKGNRFTRQDGHWITAVGFKDDHTLLAYDPSPRTGPKKELHEVNLAPMPQNGALALASWDDPIPTDGYHFFDSPYPVPDTRLVTVIDGFVLLELK
ncbi:MAG: hypothetical protein AAGD22_15165 [Verrucomicrobiota bacterium]